MSTETPLPKQRTNGAEVADLPRARGWQEPPDPDSHPDATPDTGPDTGPDTTVVPVSEQTGRGLATRSTATDMTAPGRPDSTATGGEVLEGTIVSSTPLEVPPEWKMWPWAVGWRHRLHRLWVYRNRYAWNTFVVLSTWLARVAGWWFRGAGRSVSRFAAWIDDRQGLDVADQAAGGLDGRADVDLWLKARAERHREVVDRRRVVRARTALPLVVLALVVGVALWLGHGGLVRAGVRPGLAVAWLVAGCWLVWFGRPRSVPFWPQFREPSPFPPVTNDTITNALLATGISQIRELVRADKSPVDVIYRDDTAGGKIAETQVVPGVTTDMLMAKAIVVAGALKRPPAMVHLSQAPDGVPGHVEILVLDIDPGTTKPRRFPYLAKPVNCGAPVIIGYDARNRPVRWTLPGRNTIATGTPGSGKTAFLINLGLLAAADVDGCQLAVFDFKGMGDYSDLEPVCFAYGGEPDPTDTGRLLLAALLGLKKDIIRRRRILTDLKKQGSDLLDNNAAALTDRLARVKRYAMPWLLFIIDEIHVGLADPIYGKDIAALLTDLMKIGRACGLHIVIASQRTDVDSIPSSISSLPVIRVAFHQNGQNGNDQILGTGAYKRGIDATAFRRGAEGTVTDDRGSCWFIGAEGGDPVKVRTTFVLPDAKRVIAWALARRTEAGTLIGAAAGIADQHEVTPPASALDDIRAVFVGDEIALHGDVIFHRVQTRHPGRWKSQTALMAALRAEAPQWKSPTVDVGQVRPIDAPTDPGEERTRKGIRLEHLDAALAARSNTP